MGGKQLEEEYENGKIVLRNKGEDIDNSETLNRSIPYSAENKNEDQKIIKGIGDQSYPYNPSASLQSIHPI
jgi:hypothetical protein